MTDEQLNALAYKHLGNDACNGKAPVTLEALRNLIDAACPEKDRDQHSGLPMTEFTYGAVHKVYLRVGMLVMRDLLKRAEDVTIEDFWPTALCPDPGTPRLLDWSEVATGPEDGPWDTADIAPEVEALPIALQVVQTILNAPPI